MFRALRVFVFTAVDLETQLIRHYGGMSKVAWNKSGFGSNDPGRERDTTKAKMGGFDELYPVDLDLPLSFEVAPSLGMSVARVLDMLRESVPYIVRSQRAHNDKRRPHPDLVAPIHVQGQMVTARQVMVQVVDSLPPGWQATLLPGRIILYREERHYAAGSVIARS